jgi:hypothetical protein
MGGSSIDMGQLWYGIIIIVSLLATGVGGFFIFQKKKQFGWIPFLAGIIVLVILLVFRSDIISLLR